MGVIDVDGALSRIDALAAKTKQGPVREDLDYIRGIICQQQQAQIAAYAHLLKLDKAIDAASARKRDVLGRLQKAVDAPEDVENEQALLEHVAEWCEALACSSAVGGD